MNPRNKRTIGTIENSPLGLRQRLGIVSAHLNSVVYDYIVCGHDSSRGLTI
jgi:hypothetical protein